MRPRVLIAGLFHETHTFVDESTRLEDFSTLQGAEMLACTGDASPLGGVLETAERLGWQVIPAIDMRASPGGMVPDAVVEFWWQAFQAVAVPALEAGLEAVYVVLHGAMVSPSFEDVEGELLTRLRLLPGASALPVFGVFDLHANFTPRMAEHSNCLVAYRENPHTDGRAMGVHAAELLDQCLNEHTFPRQYWRHAQIVWPPTGTGTAEAPMRDLEIMARTLESTHPTLLSVNVVAGFSFADTAFTGVSFCISSTGSEAEAEAALDALCHLAWDLREAGNRRDASLAEVMSHVADLSQSSLHGPIVIAEPADNIGGGAPGDGTALLRAFVLHRLEQAAICINDPAAVQTLQSVALGAPTTLKIGGKGSRLDEGPLSLQVELLSLRSGQFQLEDKHSHLASMCGDAFDMGPCAVVRHEGVILLLTSHKTPPFDLGQWTSQGITPGKLRVIGVKAAVAHRRAYDGIASHMLWVDTPGPCRSDVTKMPYQKLRPGVFPFPQA
ncbi:MAG: M81 family metallopeptidase [Verrucomicrobium sp.]